MNMIEKVVGPVVPGFSRVIKVSRVSRISRISGIRKVGRSVPNDDDGYCNESIGYSVKLRPLGSVGREQIWQHDHEEPEHERQETLDISEE
jgi:hypothetical protein